MKKNFGAFGLVLVSVMFGAGPVWAHGVSETGGPVTGIPEENSFRILQLIFGSAEAKATFTIRESDGYRIIEADGLPDHSTGVFPNRSNPHRIVEQTYKFRMPLVPERANRITQLGHMPFGIALNGVVFDPLTAEYWKRDRSSGWNIDALSGVMLGLDRNNAHVQPNGSYHYHGVPVGLIEKYDQGQPILLGYAADGFPIYGPKGFSDGKAGAVHELKPSWQLKPGERPGGSAGPGGAYDGTYVQDFEYVAGLGDLDQCNGRVAVTPEYPGGTYHYVISNSFPFIPRCFVGTVDDSFKRRPGQGGGNQGFVGRPGEKDPGARGMQRQRMQAGSGRQGGRPDLNAAAERLGISVQKLRAALGPPPPDFEAAASELGITAEELFQALHP